MMLPYRHLQAQGDLPLAPPFRSLGLQIDYYPLEASPEKLRAFCQHYLGFEGSRDPLPEAAGRFAPLSPFVYLMMCRHPRLEVAHGAHGWFSQRELAVGFPVGWYVRRPWGWALERWAFVDPFVYLDSPLGLGTGREVDGWSKKPAIFDVRDDALTMQTLAARARGELPARHTLLEIAHGVGTTPMDAWAQWRSLQRAATVAWATTAREVGPAVAPWLRAMVHPTSLWALWRGAVGSALDTNVITLKQFRAPGDPASAAYQALVHSTMEIERVLGASLLGATAQQYGDPSGGHRVRIGRYVTDPLVDALGLVVERTATDGVEVAELRPAFPFRVEMDIRYPVGQVLAWRTRGTAWSTRPDAPGPRAEPPRYNLSQGDAVLCRRGPFHLTDVTVRLLPLQADPAALAESCARYFDLPGARVEPVGDQVVIAHVDAVVRADSGEGLAWRQRAALVLVPARLDGELVLAVPYQFTDNAYGHISARELQGRASVLAVMRGAWSGEAQATSYFRATTEVFPAAGVGAQAVPQVVLDARPLPAAGPPAATDASAVRAWLDLHASRVTLLDVQQYRDAAEPSRAAWQRLALERVTVTSLTHAEPLESAVEVVVRDSVTLSIAHTLGLRGAPMPGDPSATVCISRGGVEARGTLQVEGLERGG